MMASLTKDEFRLLTWHRRNLPRKTIQPDSLQWHCPLDNDRLQPRSTPPTDFGDFEAFPLEIVHSIFGNLDLQSLTDFRGVSWLARSCVDSFPQYKTIFDHSPDALRALLSTHMAIHFTAQDIVEALCTEACHGCGEFGPLLDLFTANRYCTDCVSKSEDMRCTPEFSAKRKMGLGPRSTHTLPTLLSIPGEYSEMEYRYRTRVSLVRTAAVIAATSTQKAGLDARRRRLEPLIRPPLQLPELPLHPSQHIALQQASDLREHELHEYDKYQFMPMLRIPALDQKSGNLDWGVSCQACRNGPKRLHREYNSWKTIYSTAGYMEHFQKCQLSQIARTRVAEHTVSLMENQNQRIAEAEFYRFLKYYKFEDDFTSCPVFPKSILRLIE